MLLKYSFQFCTAFLLTSILCIPNLFAANSDDLAEKLLARILATTPIIDDLQELTSTIGGRPTGSTAMSKALAWSLAKFNTAGLENVHAEQYTPPRNWLAQIENGEFYIAGPNNLTSLHQPLRIATMPFSASTPENGLDGEIFNVGSGDEKAFSVKADKLKGRWLLVTNPVMRKMQDMDKDPLPILIRAKKAGALGILWLSNRKNRVLYRQTLTFNGSMAPLPAAIIEREEGKRIIQLLKNGTPVRAKLTIQNEIQEKPTNSNVIAEITGWEKPDEVIVLSAHLDSWDLGQGALDNGANDVLVIDAARQMMTLVNEGFRPRRTIRFMLYSGEELGLYGSWFDVQNHRDQLDQIKAVLVYDIGSGRTTGFSLGGRHDMAVSVAKALQPLSVFGRFKQTFDAGMDTDNFDYLIEGIPTLVANQDEKPYIASYHAETDTFDKVDQSELKRNAAIASVLIWNLANSDQAPAPRQDRSEILVLLKSTGLDNAMKNNEVWGDFLNERRGRTSS